jgi:nucleoside-diphosphate-sugar epimerase
MNIMITGVTGFLGSALARSFFGEGHVVSGTSSRLPQPGNALPPEITVSRLGLGEPVPPRHFQKIDYVIHCAHDFASGGFDRNVEGTKRVFEAARASGVPCQAFITSYSATRTSQTEYGRVKFALETFFEERGGAVLKPGLVLGSGGLGGSMLQKIKNSWVAPIPHGVTFPYVGTADFVQTVKEIVFSGQRGLHNIFYPDFTTFAEVAIAVRREVGRPFLTIPIPIGAFTRFLVTAEFLLDKMGIRLAVRSDNLKSLSANQSIQRDARGSLLRASSMTLQEIISSALVELDRTTASLI